MSNGQGYGAEEQDIEKVPLESTQSQLPASTHSTRMPSREEGKHLLQSHANMQQQSESPSSAADSPQLSNAGVLSLRFWQAFFDVRSVEVGRRLLVATILPFRPTLAEELAHKPDLYAPFWIAATLIFSTTAMSSLASFVNGSGELGYINGAVHIATGAGTFYGYAFVVPLICSFFHAYLLQQTPPRLALLMGAYGYSLAIFVPISCICVALTHSYIRIAVVLSASVWSGVFLATNITHASPLDGVRRGLLFCTLLLGHCGLGLGLALAKPFFAYPISDGT